MITQRDLIAMDYEQDAIFKNILCDISHILSFSFKDVPIQWVLEMQETTKSGDICCCCLSHMTYGNSLVKFRQKNNLG